MMAYFRPPVWPLALIAPLVLANAAPPAQPQLNAAKLLEDVRVLADDTMQGRLVGTPGSAAARAYLVQRLTAIGVVPVTDDFSHPFSVQFRGKPLNGVNLVGRIAGSGTSPNMLVVGAHYDHFGVRGGAVLNGADDNASGVATVLAIAADFIRNPPEHDVLIALWDAEEQGMFGSHAFITNPPVAQSRIAMTLNLDMLSRSTRDELWIAGAHHYPFLRPYFEQLAATAPLTLKLGHDRPEDRGSDDWTAGSDHYPFHQQGIPFAYMGVEDYPDYHGPGDDFGAIPQGFFTRSATTALNAARLFERALDAISQQSETRASDKTP